MERHFQIVKRADPNTLSIAVTQYLREGWELYGSPHIENNSPAQLMVSGAEGAIPDPSACYRMIVGYPILSLESQCAAHVADSWKPYGDMQWFDRMPVQTMIFGNVLIYGSSTPDVSPSGGKSGGFFNYQNTGPIQTLVGSTWTTLQNNGAGPLTETVFAPKDVPSMLDPATGRIKLDALKVGDQVTMRLILSSMGYVNNASVTFRNYFGQVGQQYAIPFGSSVVMNTGAGIVIGPYAVETKFYIRDENTRLGGVLPQIMSPGKVDVTFAETYISVN